MYFDGRVNGRNNKIKKYIYIYDTKMIHLKLYGNGRYNEEKKKKRKHYIPK